MAVADLSTGPPPDFVPGTVQLVDLEGRCGVAHAEDQRDVVLIPAPSNNPDDPLNWSPARKRVFLACICIYCCGIGIPSAAIYSILVPISADSGLTMDALVAGTGYMFLTLGWGCLVWQPLAQKFGKRPVYFLSLLGTMGCMIWAPHATTGGQWSANKVLQGFFGAPVESLCEISVADVWFTHERGAYLSYYALFLAGSNFLAPVFGGFIDDGQGWQWVLYWCAILSGAGFFLCFFLMEETNFQRPIVLNGDPGQTLERPVSDIPITGEKTAASDEASRTDSHQAPPRMTWTPSSYWKKLRIIRAQDVYNDVSLLKGLIRPFIYFRFPVVVFSGFMYGSVICYFNVLNGTASLILSSPPFLYAGYLSDKFVLWKSRRNGGVMEPEFRLWLYIGLMVIIPSSLILWGVGAAREVHWFGLILAIGLIGATITAGASLPIAYCIDCYKELGADAVVTIILIRNTMSFAISYGITPWIDNMGLQNAFILLAFAALVQLALFLPMIKWGYTLRKSSVKTYWKYAQQIEIEG
ncbi:hypothetical protein CEP52_016569 [Fusarium oligoseptatum]|uniref:Major facilitator superfamily (MFS) profile domain-containing protein n=1 Tax=Fusarium oligoseptatum TaxID=2604345 RepID=A0A428S2B1_9HYPO|nr:hypothetical protein CEP52_016569 [Fusarium oligoseptatum]